MLFVYLLCQPSLSTPFSFSSISQLEVEKKEEGTQIKEGIS